MYRKPRHRDRSGVLDLDSLMDILSCLVGVMLFLVIYTVLELGSTAYQVEVLVSDEPAPRSRRVVVLYSQGTVRVLDVRPPLSVLLNGFEIVLSTTEIPVFIEANRRAPIDQYFSYSLNHVSRSTTDLVEMLDLEIRERPGAVGDSIHQLLDQESGYATALSGLNPEDSWLAFAVDTASVDIFRRARELAIVEGFATGFDLLTLEFPLTVPLSRTGLDDLLNPESALSKPQR